MIGAVNFLASIAVSAALARYALLRGAFRPAERAALAFAGCLEQAREAFATNVSGDRVQHGSSAESSAGARPSSRRSRVVC